MRHLTENKKGRGNILLSFFYSPALSPTPKLENVSLKPDGAGDFNFPLICR